MRPYGAVPPNGQPLAYDRARGANREELIHLIEDLPDDQVGVLVADARRLAAGKPKGT